MEQDLLSTAGTILPLTSKRVRPQETVKVTPVSCPRKDLKENENQRTSDKDFENTGSDHECNSNRPTPLDCTQAKGVSITNTTDEHLKANKGDSVLQ